MPILALILPLFCSPGCAPELRETTAPEDERSQIRLVDGELILDEQAYCEGRDGIELIGPDPLVIDSEQGGERPSEIQLGGRVDVSPGIWGVNCSDRPLQIGMMTFTHTSEYTLDEVDAELAERDGEPEPGPEIRYDFPTRDEAESRIDVHESAPLISPRDDSAFLSRFPGARVAPGRTSMALYCDGVDGDVDMALEERSDRRREGFGFCGHREFRSVHPSLQEALRECRACNGRILEGLGFGVSGHFCDCEALDAGEPCKQQDDCEGACLEIRQTLDQPECEGVCLESAEGQRYCSERQYYRTGCVVGPDTYRVDRCSRHLPRELRADFGCE